MAKARRKPSKKQQEIAKLLGAKLMLSRTFRKEFLKNPRKAARQIKIHLSDELHREALEIKEQIVAAGKAADKALKKGEKRTLGVIPYFTLEMD